MNLKAAKKITAAFVLALLLLAGVAAISFHRTMRMTADAQWVDHSHEVMTVIEKLVKTVSYNAVSHRGFLITGDEAFLAKHPQTFLERDAAMEELRSLVADSPAQQQRLTALAAGIAEREQLAKNHVELLRREGEILKVSEREQTRLGQDLHDDLGQQLTGIAILSQVLLSQLQEESHPAAKDAEQISRCLTESISTTRNLAKSFYPVELERGGLILALQDLALRTQLLSRVHCTVNAAADFRFETPTEIHLYRIVQESINNALKHGKATHIQIDCPRENGVSTLTVTDNGNGFKAPEPGEETGMGLHIFQYRAALIGARISVRRGTPDGCLVTCAIPDYFSHA